MVKQGLLIIFIVCLISAESRGQARDKSVNFGLLYSHITSSSQKGIGLYGEYSRNINHYLTLSPSIHFMYGSTSGEFPYSLFNKSVTGIDANLFLSPVNTSKYRVRLGAGPSLSYFTGYDIKDFVILDRASIVVDGDYTVPLFYPKRKLDDPKYFSLGYGALIDAKFSVAVNWMFGLRFSYHEYLSNDKVVSLGMNLGYNF